ncbi:TerC/Alx family metal homeostasis membrane protein, partial [Deinococcus sp.]|uniref:TerC/Alx family metal homeostasis membrane protein n=1 Tax=Deinococcus sp. TaxID=47478 RepID=UPI00286E99BA
MTFLTGDWLGTPTWMWVVFMTLILGLLAFDLGILSRRRKAGTASASDAEADDVPQTISIAASLRLSVFYISVALLFGLWVWSSLGAESAVQYYTAFAIEKALSLDNVFVISLIFTALAIPRQYQHRVLFWGILGVIVLRGVMIGVGTALVTGFDWVLWVFGAFLLITGLRLLIQKDKDDSPPDIERHPVARLVRRVLPVTPALHGERFLVRMADKTGRVRLHATPLLLALAMVEVADVVFAVDSIPAVFAITQEPFLVYTSNIFAILGLRALYFALAALVHRFEGLKPALALVLVFIGAKIFY